MLCAAVTQQSPAPPWVATRVVDGKVLKFQTETITAGVSASVAMLETCCDGSPKPDAAHQKELDEALKGDHIRVVFAQPQTTTLMRQRVEYTQLVFGGKGVFWLTTPGGEVLRYTKYDYEKSKVVSDWLRSTEGR
jgi:hypothetical protein